MTVWGLTCEHSSLSLSRTHTHPHSGSVCATDSAPGDILQTRCWELQLITWLLPQRWTLHRMALTLRHFVIINLHHQTAHLTIGSPLMFHRNDPPRVNVTHTHTHRTRLVLDHQLSTAHLQLPVINKIKRTTFYL